jgi:hypothetical protein
MRLIVHAPREVVDRPDAPATARHVPALTNVHHAPAVAEAVARPALLRPERFEPEHAREEAHRGVLIAFPQAAAVQTAHLGFAGHCTVRPGGEWPFRIARALNEREPQSMRIGHRQHLRAEPHLGRRGLRAVALETRRPERQAVERHFEPDFNRETVPHPRRRHLRPRKEREVGAGPAFGVGIEEMVGTGIVLIDALLDEAHAEDAGVEVEILLRRTGDGGDVMQPVHAAHPPMIPKEAARV